MISVSRSNISRREIRYSFFKSHVRLFGHGKLRSKWEGPFLVLNAADHGPITLQDDDGNVFKANGQRLKIFLEPEIPELEEVDVYELTEVE